MNETPERTAVPFAYQRVAERLAQTDGASKEIMDRERQAMDAKTARLRKLRLEARPDDLSWMDKQKRD